MVLFNYRGKRTWFAAGLVLMGSVLIIQTELYTGELTGYYYGAGLLLLGVWSNASLLYFYKRWIAPSYNYLLTGKFEIVQVVEKSE